MKERECLSVDADARRLVRGYPRMVSAKIRVKLNARALPKDPRQRVHRAERATERRANDQAEGAAGVEVSERRLKTRSMRIRRSSWSKGFTT